MRFSRLPLKRRAVDPTCKVNVRQLPALTVALAAAASIAAAATMAIFGVVLSRIAASSYNFTGDFLSFYAAGYLVRTGQGVHLYDPGAVDAAQRLLYPGGFDQTIGYPLPVFAAWLFAPLSYLPFTAAFFLYAALTAALLAGLLSLLARQLADVPRGPRRLFLACAALALPSLATIVFGQVDLIALAGLMGGYLLLRSGRRTLAGLPLCLVLIKPHLLLGVALLLVVRREWRTIGVLAGAGLPLLIAPALIAGPVTLIENVREMARLDNTLLAGSRAGVMANWRGFIASATNSNQLVLWAPGAIAIAAGAVAIAVSRWRSEGGTAAFGRDYSLAVLLPLLVSPHVHTQTLVVALLPGALLLRAYLTPGAGAEAAGRATNTLLGLYTLLFALPFLAIQGLSLTVFLVAGGYLALALRWPGIDTARERRDEASADGETVRARAA